MLGAVCLWRQEYYLVMLWSQIHQCSRSIGLQLIDIDGNPLALKGVIFSLIMGPWSGKPRLT